MDMTVSPQFIEYLSQVSAEGRVTGLVEQNPQLRERATIVEIADQVNHIAREDLDKAERLGNLVAWLSELTADEFCRARSLRCLGNIRVLRSNYQEAVDFFERSLEICRSLAMEREEAAALSSQLQPLIYLGRYKEAFSKSTRARQIASRLGDALLLARIGINSGNILHRLERFPEAIDAYKAGLNTLDPLGQRRDCAIGYLNLAVCYISLNDFAQARDAYVRARSLSVSENMSALVAQADYNIAYLHYHCGEYVEAIELYQRTRRYCLEIGDNLHQALCDLDEAEIYVDLHLHQETTELATQAHAAFRKLQMPYEATKALVWLAVAYYQAGKRFRALSLLANARENMRIEGNTTWTAILDLYQALIFQREGRFYEALRQCSKARAEFPEGGPRATCAQLVHATLQLETGASTQALATAQRALDSAEKLKSSQLLAHAYLTLGRCQEVLNRRQDAMKSYETSSEWFDKIPVQTDAESLKIPFLNKRADVFESILNLAVRRESTTSAEEVLAIVEKSRALEISELVSSRSNSLKTPSKNRSALVEQLKKLREALNWYYYHSDNSVLPAQNLNQLSTEQVNRSIRERENSLLQTLEAIRGTEEEFHYLQAGGDVPVDRIRSLNDDETLLELFQTGASIYALLLTRSTCDIIPLTRSALLRDHLRNLHSCFAGIPLLNARPLPPHELSADKTLAVLNLLYKDLVDPIVSHILDRRLIIAPEGPLRYVPMHALFDGNRFLLDMATLSYAGGAVLHYLSVKKTPISSGRDLVIVSNQDSVSPSSTFPGFSQARTLEQLQSELTTNRHVHLECQLQARFDNPMFSSITIGESTKTILDLFNTDCTCGVLGLTGIAPGIRADGDGKEFEGLARAFEYAGARSLLLPLWETHQDSTNNFFKTFYQEAARNEDLAIAFRSTLVKLRSEYAHPFYWAPFVLRGQTRRSNRAK
jgi:tetratricopeptide (TPR) repeat protein